MKTAQAGIKDPMKKATTELLVLFALRKRPMYTYAIMQEIAAMSGGSIKFNTIYQTIYRLKEGRYIQEQGKEMADNRVRLYFSITPKGSVYLEQLKIDYCTFTNTMDRILGVTRTA